MRSETASSWTHDGFRTAEVARLAGLDATLKPTMRVAGFDLSYSDEEMRSMLTAFEKILRSGFISMGANVEEFERQ